MSTTAPEPLISKTPRSNGATRPPTEQTDMQVNLMWGTTIRRAPITVSQLIGWLLILALVRGMLYAIIIPPWQGPDEPAHFERAKAAFSDTVWTTLPPDGPSWYDELATSMFAFRFWDYAMPEKRTAPGQHIENYVDLYLVVYGGLYGSRLTYALIGWPSLLVAEQSVVLQLYLMRFNMVLMGVAIIYLSYRLSRTIFPHRPLLMLGVPILLTFSPQYTHLLSTVNNGNLAHLFAAGALLFLARGGMYGFSGRNILLILLLSVAAMWTKATAYFLFFTLTLICLLSLVRYWRYWYLLLPGSILLAMGIYTAAPQRLGILLSWRWQDFISGNWQLHPDFLPHVFASFWAMPGWLQLRVHPMWYQILLIFCLISLLGLLWKISQIARQRPIMIRFVQHPKGHQVADVPLTDTDRLLQIAVRWRTLYSMQARRQGMVLGFLAIAISTAAAIQIGWHVLTGSFAYSQGRSIFPVIGPIYLFLLLGWRQFIPHRLQNSALLALTCLALLFDSLVLLGYIMPFFYSYPVS